MTAPKSTSRDGFFYMSRQYCMAEVPPQLQSVVGQAGNRCTGMGIAFFIMIKCVLKASLKPLSLRGRPFDSEGGGGGWHFLEINILTLKMLGINNLSYSGKKINNLT